MRLMSGITRARGAAVLAVAIVAVAMFVPADSVSSSMVDAFAPREVPIDTFYDPAASMNGCGSQGADGIDVPDSFLGIVDFGDACDKHDACYGTEGMSRSACDEQMLRDTLEACGLVPGCASMAVAYYLGVRAGGGQPYDDGQVDARSRNFSRARRGARQVVRAHGDPHIVTRDGANISFQAAGVFLFGEADREPFVQARTFPVTDHMSVITGVAIRVGASVVTVQLDRESLTTAVLVDGEEVTQRHTVLKDAVVTIGGLPGTTGTVSVWRPDGIQMDVSSFGRNLDMTIAVPSQHPSTFTGLMFNGGGSDATVPQDAGLDDLATTSGYNESIRLGKADSWFVEGAGDGFDYHDPSLTKFPLPLPDLSDDLISAATEACLAAGVDSTDLNSCVFDVIASGDTGWATRAALSAVRARTLAGGDANSIAGEVPSPGAFVRAVASGDTSAARALLKAGADPNAPGAPDLTLEGFIDAEILPLSVAVGGSDAIMVALLLDAGADPNGGVLPGDLSNVTPLDEAALADELEIMVLLLDAGARADRGLFAGDTGASLIPTLLSPEAAALLSD